MDKLVDVSLLPPVATTALSLITSRPSAKTTKPVSLSTSSGIVYKALFSSSSFVIHEQEWFKTARLSP
jgi:hypothetical protein